MTADRTAAAGPTVAPTLVFLVPNLARGGMLSVMRDAWQHLREHRIVVITQERSPERVPHETIEVARAFGDPLRFPGAWLYAWRMARAAGRVARSAPGGAVLVPQDALATGAAAVVAGRRTGTPVVVMDHGSAIVYRTPFFWRNRLARSRLNERLREPLLRWTLRLLHRIAIAGADRVLLPSREAVERFAADGVRRERIARYHVPIDLDRFRPPGADRRRETRRRIGVGDDEVLAVSISRLTPEKGLLGLLDAVGRLPADRRPVVAIGGIGPLRDAIPGRAAALGVDARMLGAVAPEELPDLLGAADLVVYAAEQGTNVPVAILEAMACGRFVVATDQPPATRELLGDGRGIVVPAGEVDRFAEALAAAIEMGDARRDDGGEAARRWIEAEHRPERIAAELAAAMKVGPPRRPAPTGQ